MINCISISLSLSIYIYIYIHIYIYISIERERERLITILAIYTYLRLPAPQLYGIYVVWSYCEDLAANYENSSVYVCLFDRLFKVCLLNVIGLMCF